MPQTVLVQPPSHGRLSGGFLYNAQMAQHGAWGLVESPAEQLLALVDRLGSSQLVLMDSIWLSEAHLQPFLARRARGGRVGVMLHSFPSMIAAAEAGRDPLTRPSRFELEAIERLGLVVVPGRHYADLLSERDVAIATAVPGLDAGWRAEPRRRAGPCRLVSVGAATPRKGFLDVLEALEPRRADFSWTVVGNLEVDREYAARLQAEARHLPGVVFEGQQPPHRVQEIVRASDVLVMPSYDENQPLVLLEAMAASVPAVAYAAGATRHMLEHGRQGLIAPIGDKRCLSEHLNRLMDSEATRYTMASECWERQHSLPNWSTAAQLAREALWAASTIEPGQSAS